MYVADDRLDDAEADYLASRGRAEAANDSRARAGVQWARARGSRCAATHNAPSHSFATARRCVSELGHDAGVWFPLMNLAAVAQMYGDLVRAATLFGTVEALRLRQGAVVPPEQARIDERLRTLRGQLSERRILGRSRMGGA